MTQQAAYLYFEDLTIGQTFKAGPTVVTESEVIAFASKYDPQPFHTDAAKAKDTFFGELVASGWHTAAMTMRMILEASPPMKGGMVGRTIEKMNWPRPVRPGDELSLTIEILELFPASKLPTHGMMRTKNTVTNQHGKTAMDMDVVIFVPRKSAA